MGAPKKNQFWKLRSKHGRNNIFKSPDELWNGALDYFKYIDENPIEVEDNKGTKNVNKVKLIRPYTKHGLAIHLGIHPETLDNYKAKKDFFEVVRNIELIIYNQKFEGAVIGIFKENIIVRELGLAEKSESKDSITLLNKLKDVEKIDFTKK